MARTSGNLTAGNAINRHNGNGKGSRGRAAGLVATAALGLALLAGVVFSQARPAARSTDSQAGNNPVIVDTQFVPDQFTYREDHRAVTTACVASSAAGVPGEGCGTAGTTADTPAFVPDQFTYREDHRSTGGSGVQIWAGTCRPNSIDCLPDDEYERTSDGVIPGFLP